MSGAKRDNSVHVRLSDEADAMLELLRSAANKDKASLAGDLLERALLGEGHALRMAALRFARSGLVGTDRDGQGS